MGGLPACLYQILLCTKMEEGRLLDDIHRNLNRRQTLPFECVLTNEPWSRDIKPREGGPRRVYPA